jgi:predicted nucleic-acid-binding protein
MIAIDTNVLLRFFQLDNDLQQAKLAQAFIRRHAPVFLNHMVIVEFVWTCRRVFKMERMAIHMRLEAIAESTEFEIENPALFDGALHGYGKIKSDFADWLIAASNLQQGCEATFTFDQGALKCSGFRRLA